MLSKTLHGGPGWADEITADITEILLFLRALRAADTPSEEYRQAVETAAPACFRLLVWCLHKLSP